MDTGALAWLVGGVLALAAELFTGTFVLLMVGGAALGAAVAAAFAGGPVPWIVFAVLAVFGLWLIRPWAVRRLRGGAGTRTNVDALTGGTAYAVAPFDPVTRVGRVKIDGVEWRARLWEGTPGGDALARLTGPGTTYWVQEVRGATLIVVPMASLADAGPEPAGSTGKEHEQP